MSGSARPATGMPAMAERALRTPAPWLEVPLADLLDEIAADSRIAGASSVAAVSVALAAALSAKSARRSEAAMNSAAGAAAQADSLRRRALALGELNAEAYGRAAAALPASDKSEGSTFGGVGSSAWRDLEIGEALARTNDALLALLELAGDVVVLAELVAENGEPGARPDAAVAATLAEAGARAASHLIEINLLSGGSQDVRGRARAALEGASETARRARAAGR